MPSSTTTSSQSPAAIPWSKIKALSFDIYGTLIDWENGIASAARSTVLGPHLPTSHRQLMVDIEKHDTTVQRENPTMLQRDIISEGLRRYAAELQVPLPPAEIASACEAYGAQIGAYPAFDDTVAAMRKLKELGFVLVPLSNVDGESFAQTLRGPLAGCGDVFDAVYTAEMIGSYKPDLKNFEYLLEHVRAEFGVEKDQLCHVAQSLFHDHGPASKVGLKSVWVDRGGIMGGETEGAQEKYGFELRVESLGELARIVEDALKEEKKA